MSRAELGTKGSGRYIRIIVRPKWKFVDFRYHDVGEPGHIQRLAGMRKNGRWATHVWLIEKTDVRVEKGKIIPKSEDVRNLLSTLATAPVQIKGDLFKAKDRKNVPERLKPTEAMMRAWNEMRDKKVK